MLLFSPIIFYLEKLLEIHWMISEHVFSRLTFAFEMCSYNILKTMLVLFYPVVVECSADILVYLTAAV